jgi:hypothetical protein
VDDLNVCLQFSFAYWHKKIDLEFNRGNSILWFHQAYQGQTDRSFLK